MMLSLISDYEIETQDELIELLRQNGHAVTQATVSRDIRELHISKMTTGRGTYRYVAPRQKGRGGLHLGGVMETAIVKVEHAGNMVVIKTNPGLANAVAVSLDGMRLDQILGSVAGDDTILMVARSEESAEEICSMLRGFHYSDEG